MVVSLEESPPLPRKRQPDRAEGGEDVNSASDLCQSSIETWRIEIAFYFSLTKNQFT